MTDTLDPLGLVAAIRAAVQAKGAGAVIADAIVASGFTATAGPGGRESGTLHPDLHIPPGAPDDAAVVAAKAARYGLSEATVRAGDGTEEATTYPGADGDASVTALGFQPGRRFMTGEERTDVQHCAEFQRQIIWKLVHGYPVDGEPYTAAQLAEVKARGDAGSQDAAARHQADLYAWDLAHPDQPPQSERGKAEADRVLKLHGGRFRVTAAWTSGGRSGPGKVFGAFAGNQVTGGFYFAGDDPRFSPENLELVVKLVDFAASGFFLAVAPLTDVGVALEVTDTKTGAKKSYHNPEGTPFRPVQEFVFAP
jgi:hypothetical protein